ncbi:MAG TPA: pantetheine-phosphate adenylyltransferase [Acidimicrobiales bacterium]
MSDVGVALVPGSFDPIHNGHIEIIERASVHFDEVLVAAIRNPQKDTALFTLEEREAMILEALSHLSNIRIGHFKGLLVDYCRDQGVTAIVKGLRTISDFEYEMAQAQMNRAVGGIDTLFIPAGPQTSFLASKLVREVARFGADVAEMVPPAVATRLKERFADGPFGAGTVAEP